MKKAKIKQYINSTKLTKDERISAWEDLRHLINGYIYYPICTWPSSVKKTPQTRHTHQ